MTKAATGVRGVLLLLALATALALAAVALGRPEERSEPRDGRAPAPQLEQEPEQHLPIGGSPGFFSAA